ncbi:phosphoglycerate mutase [Paramecium bursaria Chlorella virus NYs1]|uniref:Phosphoglycerate mutase n=1 Tax=Paramecium bursaria Chlorella virus NYs1 TaxID=83442 RepID=M1I8X2_9PHYC|nr:phosphoglycerate mutase [Paramecium bursaria Chlorella virus NYs1]AGE54870.1 phosphoglycerate mutase [Paramecium bursaria Chlorella virus MA1D]AGE58726.1 phosphoglycerate mutase [Paramecium bursaria Chlorella virus NYs1]
MQILLMRHGEKYKNVLSEDGQMRAKNMTEYFRHHRPFDVSFPTHVIAMKPKKKTSSTRCIDTVSQFAKENKLPLYVIFTREEINPLMRFIRKLPKHSVPLICWEHHWIVNIARELEFPVLNWNDTPMTLNVDTKVFNVLWKITSCVFESYNTFDVDNGHISYYFHPLKQKIIRTCSCTQFLLE